MAFALFAVLAVAVSWLDRENIRISQGTARIVDGDSIELDGQRIRLLGIDAPEYRQNCTRNGRQYPCGKQSRAFLLQLTQNKTVTCRGAKNDQYGRFLASCEAGGADLNRLLVAEGWAVAYGDFEDEEKAARKGRRGMWAGEFERPRQWRDRQSR
ncbi:thermonuclease family protein [Aquamicrobium segne]|uniref:Thermonuclease family protein n=1 Tax=Aquamicrobium segne TaxID=469547 RepID=A0ABW0GYC2_9HYPH